MDRFLNIDWKLPLDHIIDNTFIDGERLQKESAMHRLMTDNFSDPFKNIQEDSDDIKVDLIRDIDPDIDEEVNDTDNETDIVQPTLSAEKENKLRPYVPGIVHSIFKYPRRSNLNKRQQAMCLKVLLRFSESDKPKLTPSEREELQIYMDLQQVISQEQDEFLEFAKSKWQERSLKITCEDYINLHWKSKLEYIHKLPRYYSEVTNVQFLADKNIEVKFLSVCLKLGNLSRIMLPTFARPYMLRINSEELQNRFLSSKNISSKATTCSKLPVSEDPNCEKLVESNNVDLVISSSGLNCLVNNFGPNYSNSWILPVVIKRHNDKNVIYIDKPTPPIASTIPEKNAWVYKHILKYFFPQRKHAAPESIKQYDDNIFGNVNSEELLKLEAEYENAFAEINSNSVSNVAKKNENLEEYLTLQTAESHTVSVEGETREEQSPITSNFSNCSSISNQGTESKKPEARDDYVSYSLFSIGPQFSEQNELMKNISRDYRILIRTKTDGFEIVENNVLKLLLLAPKVEHQTDLGAEVVTLGEALKQWISLIFRPHTYLARVRINAMTSEVLQIEHRTVMSISNEIKRLYNVKAEDSLIILHNVIESLTSLCPGRYILRHTVRNGAFASVLKEEKSPGKNMFDMHTVYAEKFHTLPNPSWIPIDKTIPTPMLRCFERMPAMFYPVSGKMFPVNKKSTKAAKSTVRRSLRNTRKNVEDN